MTRLTPQGPRPAPRPARSRGRGALAAALLAGTAALAGTAPAGAQEIRAVMHSGIRVLDPVITTAHITRNHGYMIYDTLLAMDANQEVRPQMADWAVSEDGLTYTFTLRDGLRWHDGEPVTAADVVASLRRWGERDAGGQMLMDYVEGLEATDERTVAMTLTEPFTYALELIAKPSGLPSFIMPERVAQTPSSEAITDHTGSGPFVFVEEEYQPGVQAAYRKNEDYVPREEEPSWLAGGKVVNVDRVTWVTMPDAQTAMNALMGGEIDFMETVPIDLLPILEANPDLVVDVVGDLGYQTMARLNWLHPPFDDPEIRRAALEALGQEPVLAAMMGNPEYYQICGSIYGCGTPLETDAGSEAVLAGPDPEAARERLEAAGYDGTPVVLMQPTDVSTLVAQPVVGAQLLRDAGFTVDLQPMDWQTLVTRRASQEPPDAGGWNMFFTNWVIPEVWSPVNSPMLNGGGNDAWFGWPDDPALDELRRAFAQAETPEAQQEIAAEIQRHALDVVNYVPLGQYLTPSAWRSSLDGVLEAPVPVFWNIQKAE